ncbi:MAG: sigma-54-dependent Fis family transcriptional regulator [Saprospiraceae bacterium]|jgi:two-component system, NtrC family, nitrogen regulation response regulator NtrX|uniref:Sigma-54-dependent Fis family transcriptional regulator n=1 Tax=Candidatus Defluviibacterium haderslevense TaxID=2981993 RepID=A0A9D7SCJ2_9BACT|nr:sigma-54-dependent Fis family transcriptional regulator [Candidatus Defluviibacterium haderslevense]MCC7025504.1 sigma-54-dependent Fis family transcriptional regulator [Saprospiraceae bacterium]MBK8244207.1 sigma-54-dependent Fis family transcriptional regulator [Candidatus Defluviibacterium haderslevense]MBK9719303.1 sigma-54-dependent Fis family transcriptional regulator [Candidatus Defluviibacterium haderslevense]MBL0235103.1 sigma-54-dependent Fis family transcriptional regulator [Candi
MARILIVDDESAIRRALRDILELEKYQVDEATDGLDCLVKLKQNEYDAIILDIKMPKMDGMEALDKIQLLSTDTPIVMISGHATIDTAVEAVKKGAYDFISKPPDLNRLLITLRNAIDKSSLISEKKILQRKVSKFKTQEIVGESKIILKVRATIDLVAPTEARVLITGQNGTGKELVARWIHEKSLRNNGAIVEVNCAAIPSELIESELFGHEKGSFTSAIKQRLGKFELANGGTLFLDEIGDMSLSAQAKVLRALQENRITRVGGDKEIPVDVRIIAATNKDLREEISKGNFREDLYHRLAVIIIEVPSLNERIEDIPVLTEHFMEHICHEYGMPLKRIDDSAIEELQKYNWTGNIRELRNVVERLIILSKQKISRKEVLDYVIPASQRHNKFKELFEQFDSVQELNEFIKKEFNAYKSV